MSGGAGGGWQAGLARSVITPDEPLWLAGYGSERRSEGARHALWAKALALEDAAGERAVLVTTDLVGFSPGMFQRITASLEVRCGLTRAQVLLTASHNHCAPVTSETLPDYYPIDAAAWEAIGRYTDGLEARIVETVDAALSDLAPATLEAGEGEAAFAVNRRNNREAEVAERLARGETLAGPVDHRVPTLAVRAPDGALRALVFGYACHPTTLSDTLWCGDYPGYAQLELEARFPGAVALFWTGCGADQNPLPRRRVAWCEAYGRQLADGVAGALAGERRCLEPRLRTAFESVSLPFERVVTRAELEADAAGENALRARWAQRLLEMPEEAFPRGVEYAVSVWDLGGQCLIALGAEAVVDYADRFRQEFGPHTWVCGYAHAMVGYVPSRRVWDEGGYEGAFLYEYGWPAHRWIGDVEERIAAAVQEGTRRVGGAT